MPLSSNDPIIAVTLTDSTTRRVASLLGTQHYVVYELFVSFPGAIVESKTSPSSIVAHRRFSELQCLAREANDLAGEQVGNFPDAHRLAYKSEAMLQSRSRALGTYLRSIECLLERFPSLYLFFQLDDVAKLALQLCAATTFPKIWEAASDLVESMISLPNVVPLHPSIANSNLIQRLLKKLELVADADDHQHVKLPLRGITKELEMRRWRPLLYMPIINCLHCIAACLTRLIDRGLGGEYFGFHDELLHMATSDGEMDRIFVKVKNTLRCTENTTSLAADGQWVVEIESRGGVRLERVVAPPVLSVPNWALLSPRSSAAPTSPHGDFESEIMSSGMSSDANPQFDNLVDRKGCRHLGFKDVKLEAIAPSKVRDLINDTQTLFKAAMV